MHDGCNRPYRIPLMGGGNMVSADLHADHYFVRLAKYHGTQSGHGFGQCQAGTSVQDAENIKEIILTKLTKNAEKYPINKAKGNAKKYTEL